MVTKTSEGATSKDASAGNAALAAAETFEASGAPAQTVADVDPAHPAVDANPRANTTSEQNRIDFNDPTIDGAEAVAQSLSKSN